ncbi:Group 1 glycosyl transferase [Exiguobacterium antarcticum B7]|nr:Group 1 glycosyl transferase [Exiguobacterium antarcticum B7]
MSVPLLFLTPSDIRHPDADFSDFLLHELFKRVADEFSVTCLTPAFFGGRDVESLDGVTYIRRGTPLTFAFHVLQYLRHRPVSLILLKDVSFIELVLKRHFVPRVRILLTMPKPYFSWSPSDPCVVFHPSFLTALTSQGHNRLTRLPEGLDLLSPDSTWHEKEGRPTFVYVSRPSQPEELFDVCQAFIACKQEFQDVQLWIIGTCPTRFDTSVPEEMHSSIQYLGELEPATRRLHISRATALLVPSHQDNWGMAVYEAARVGTPAIVYDVPGLCDTVQYGMTGYLTKINHSGGLATEMRSCIVDDTTYQMLRYAAHQFATTKQLHDLEPAFREWLRINIRSSTVE